MGPEEPRTGGPGRGWSDRLAAWRTPPELADLSGRLAALFLSSAGVKGVAPLGRPGGGRRPGPHWADRRGPGRVRLALNGAGAGGHVGVSLVRVGVGAVLSGRHPGRCWERDRLMKRCEDTGAGRRSWTPEPTGSPHPISRWQSAPPGLPGGCAPRVHRRWQRDGRSGRDGCRHSRGPASGRAQSPVPPRHRPHWPPS